MTSAAQLGSSEYICDFAVEEQLKKLKPTSVVDFGSGGGKYARIVRRVVGEDCALTAVEGCASTVRALEAARLYHSVRCDLLQDWLERDAGHYSVAIFGDVIEHLWPWEVRRCMKLALKKFDHIIIVCPLHDIFQEGATYEGGEYNALEKHKTYITRGFFDRYDPISQHVVVGEEFTIMNVLIQTHRPKKPLMKRAAWNTFHLAMLALQPVGLARPTVDLLKMTMGRFKWILGR